LSQISLKLDEKDYKDCIDILMDEITSLAILIFGGLSLRFALTISGQAWAKSHAQTVAFMILPVITYVITNTIAGNIALSLGMIGALSIVRFRHPVKSALELIMYFDLITIGIATSVRTKWAIQLILCTIVIIFAVKIVQKIVQKSGRSFYTTSFNEGVALNSIEVFAKEKIDLIENSNNLVSLYNNTVQNEIIYRLTFENKNELNRFKKGIEGSKSINKININFV
tara:strand:- start:320 stop:997 length:678 start_codon:yes stop_codon:yes gene_type:complete